MPKGEGTRGGRWLWLLHSSAWCSGLWSRRGSLHKTISGSPSEQHRQSIPGLLTPRSFSCMRLREEMGTNPVSMAQAPPWAGWAASRDVCYFLPPWPVFVPEAAARPLSAGRRRPPAPRAQAAFSGQDVGVRGHSCPAVGFSAGPCSAPLSQLSSRAEPALFPRSPGGRFCASLQSPPAWHRRRP